MSDVSPAGDDSGASTQAPADETATVVESWGTQARSDEPPWTMGAGTLRYVVFEELGRGGMGRVLRAYDPKLQREVALKEVHRDALDEGANARLVVEARAMAKLSHPNVVAVYDVEEVGPGRVVLVMEHVQGSTLRRWLSEAERGWHEVVALLVQAGRGLTAAHAAGLLHRDFKPTNVLVREDGVAKVMDFGLAKMTGTSVSSGACSVEVDETTGGLTHAGIVMGTPRYMAPEQHLGEVLTPAADQYAFCVTSWEALCGEPPFSAPTVAEVVQRKLEGRPTWSGPNVPRPIVDAIRRGLSPDPGARWPSMDALLQALAWEPAQRRNRWLMGLGAVGMLGLLGVTVRSWADARAARCSGAQQRLEGIWDDDRRRAMKTSMLGIDRSYAALVWERTERTIDAYAADWLTMYTDACEATTVRGEQSTAVMDLRMACLHRAAVELGAITSQLADADEKVVQNAHLLTESVSPLSRCADVDALSADVEPPRPEQAPTVEQARARLADSRAARKAGHYARAKASVEAARAALAGVEYGPARTELALEDGLVLDRLGAYAEAEASLDEAQQLASQWGQWNELGQAVTRAMYVVGYQQKKNAEGLRYRAVAEGLAHGDPLREASVALTVGSLLMDQGKHEEAEAEYRRALVSQEQALGAEHALVAASRNNLANALLSRGRYEEAEAEHRKALALREQALGPEHPDVAASRLNLAHALQSQGRYAEAEVELRRALVLGEQALGPEHPDLAASRNNLANLLSAQGKHAEAEAELRAALAAWERALGPEHPAVAGCRSNIGNELLVQGKLEEAEDELGAALALMEKALGSDHPDVARSRGNLASALVARGKLAEAEEELRASLAVMEEALGSDHPDVATARVGLAGVLLDQERAVEALELAERAWSRLAREDVPAGARADAAFVLARALWEGEGPGSEQGAARARALELATQARREYASAEGALSERALELDAWLQAHPAP